MEKETAGTEPDPEPKSLDEMTDEEILIAGESMLKTAKEMANKEGMLDITFSGDDLALWLRYQEVKKAAQATPGGRRMLKAVSNQAEIQRIYARNYGDMLSYISARLATWGNVYPVGTHVHYDTNTNNAVYCANINRHFVDSTIYEVGGQWKEDEMYSALSYTFENGVKKLNGGDVKSVQGDSGHAQAKMVTDQYSHILDEDRRTNAQRFEEAFYSGKSPSSARSSADTGAAGDAATLMKLLTNPETVSLLKALVNAMGNEESK